ncbi:hypothetical protein [Deinococcus roseus]|uniref:Uncharacterized protein n=1 Tax=Deinococcus roseus TaxID=392414 RepID=A0ABQ2D1L8_9DEIO|nr:hypothetical protein [Deinococcus roseus]GGJ34682.1 hypothetical protein GCM10008938_21100 [Deinococcus roseus]
MDTFLQQKPEILGLDFRSDAILGLVVTIRFQDRHLICLGVQQLQVLASPLVLPFSPLLMIYPQHHDNPDEMLYTIKDDQGKFISLFCEKFEFSEVAF